MKLLREIHFPKTQLISTENGFENNQLATTANLAQELLSELPSAKVSPMKFSEINPIEKWLDCIDIETVGGRLSVPSNVTFQTSRGRVRATDLKIDDDIEHFICDPTVNAASRLKPTAIELEWKAHYTRQGKVCGALVASGAIRKTRVKNSTTLKREPQMVLQICNYQKATPEFLDIENHHPLAAELKSYFGKTKIRSTFSHNNKVKNKDGDEAIWRSKITHLYIPKHFLPVIFEDKNECIQWVLNQPPETMRAFLRVLYTVDASLSQKRLRLPCKDLDKLNMIKLMLTRFGVHSFVKENKVSCKGVKRISYLLIIDGDDLFRFQQYIGFEKEYDFKEKNDAIIEFKAERDRRNKVAERPYSKITNISKEQRLCYGIAVMVQTDICKLGLNGFKCYF